MKRPQDFPSVGRAVRYAVERNNLQKTLQTSERRFSILFHANPVAVGLTRATDYRIVDVNEAWENLTGYTRADVIGKTSSELGLARADTLRQVRGTLGAYGEIHQFEGPLYTRSGAERIVLLSSEQFELDGQIYFLNTLLDITERKQAEMALQKSQADLEQAQAIAHLGFWRIDPNLPGGAPGDWSKEMYALFDWDLARPQPTFNEFLELIHPQDRERLLQEHHGSLETQQQFTLEFRSNPQHGKVRYFQATAIPSITAQGTPLLTGTLLDITAIREAAEQARQSEAQFATIFHTSPIGIILTQLENGLVLNANEAFLRLFGYQHAEVIGRTTTALQVYPNPEDRARLIARLAERGHLLYEEAQFRRKSGEIGTVLLSAEIIELNGQQNVLSMMIDITERKQAEESLRLQSAALNAAENEIIITDRQGVIIWVNPAWCRVSGYTPEEALGKNPRIVQSGTHDRAFYQEMWGQILAGNTWHSEMVNKRKDGTLFQEDVTISPVRDNQGHITHFVGIKQDITDRKRAEAELRDSEQQLRALVSSLDDIVFEVDVQGAYLNVWTANEALLFQPRAQIIGRRFDEVFGAKASRPFFDALRRVLASGRSETVEYPVKVAGNQRWFAAQFHPIQAPDRATRTVSILVRDITERKQAATLLNQRLEDLDLINTLNKAVNQGATIVAITELLAAEAKKLFGTQAVSIYLLDPDKQRLILQHFTMSREYVEKLERLTGRAIPQIDLPVGGDDHFSQALYSEEGILIAGFEGICAWLRDFSNTSFLSNQVRLLLRKIIPAAAKLLKIKSVISIPLKAGDKVLGLIEFTTEDAFDESTLARLRNVRHQLAEAIVRKQAEQSLRESNEQYRLLSEELEERVRQRTAEVQDLYDNAPAGYHSIDVRGNFVAINQTELNWLGYTREEVLGHHYTEFVTAAGCEVFARKFAILKQYGEIHNLEVDLVRKDGSTLPVVINSVAVRDASGNFVQSRATVFDNTEHLRAEQALRESEERNRLLVENSPDAIVLFNAMGEIVGANRSFELLTGLPHGQGIGRTMDALGLLPADQVSRLAGTAVDSLNRGSDFAAVEFKLQRRDGDVRDVGVRVFGMLLQGKQHFLASMHDITAEKQAGETLRLANAELARALRMKDEFLANMSHELRTPLHGILAMSEMLDEQIRGPLNERQHQAVRQIENSGRHLLDLINDLLDLSKIEAGKLELNLGTAPVDDVCQASLQFVREMALRKSIQLGYANALPGAQMVVDTRRLKQMLVNLLSNAIKFTPEGGQVSLHVSLEPGATRIHFAVQDTGPGIARADQARLFQPFTQLDSRLSRQHEGTGLGLALVKRLAEQHGGAVRLDSAGIPGQGSRFTITLPYAPAAEQAPAGAAGTEPAGDLSAPAAVSGLLLLVEDNEVNIEVMEDFLTHVGYRILVARTGFEALKIVQTITPDVILMDVHLPGLDGLEVTRRLRTQARFAATPIIAVTAAAMTGDRERCLAAGATDYLSKPLGMKDLLEMIKMYSEPQRS